MKKFQLNKEIIIFIVLSFLLYFLFLKNIFSYQFNFWNSDATIKMFPVRVFLSEKLSNFEFPFWTERVFLGYPFYLDIENGALNPINLISILLLGPVWSLKFLHLISFLIGSFCIYLTIKKLYPNSNLFGILAGVAAFYFSFFHLNHLVHMNIVLVSMLLPVNIFLALKFFETEKIKYLILQILIFSYGILWGQPQITFYIVSLVFLFYFHLTSKIKETLKYLFLVLFSTFCLTFYQLYPSFSVFLSSPRIGSGLIKYGEFTNSPTLLFSNLFPYSLGYYQNFVGYEVSGAFSFVETYNYIGVTIVVLILCYLIFGQKDKNFNFVRNTVYFYLFFTFLSNFFNGPIPIYNNFRYWTRGIILISFISLFCINYFISIKKEDVKAKFNHLFYIFVILVITFFFESKDYINFLIANQFIYVKKIEFVIWILLISASTLAIFLHFKNKISIKTFSILFFLIVVFDLRYYADDFLPLRVSRYKSESNFKTDPECLNKRCLLENQKYNGYEFLMFKTYSPFGYSQFINKEYTDFFDSNFNTNIEQSPRSEVVRPFLNTEFLKDMGFQKILLADGNFYTFPENNIWILKENKLGKFLSDKEGNYEFEVKVSESRYYELNLKHSDNFEVTVNGKKISLEKNGIFSKVYLEKGENRIKISYFPKDIILGMLIGLSLFSVFLICLKILKFRIFQK